MERHEQPATKDTTMNATMTETRIYRISYVSPESGYTMVRPESIEVNSWDELEALIERVDQMNATDGARFGVTYKATRQR